MRIRTLQVVQSGREPRPAGSEFEVGDVEGERLIARKVAVLAAEREELSPEQAAFVALTAPKAVEYLGTVPTLELLSSLASAEQSRKGAPRKTVQEAFAARGAALTGG